MDNCSYRGGIMTEFEEDCLKTYGVILNGKCAHYCPEWDFMPIDETVPEFEACNCEWEFKDH